VSLLQLFPEFTDDDHVHLGKVKVGASHNRGAFLDSRIIKSGGFECNGVNHVFIEYYSGGQP
jgi:hypothetical protein